MKSFILILALLSTACTFAAADTSNVAKVPVAVATATPTAAQSELQKMSDLLKGAEGVTYTSKVTLALSPGQNLLECDATVEKSGKIAMTISPMGTGQEQIISDGANVILYDSGSAKYSKATAGSSLPSSMSGFFSADQALYVKSHQNLMRPMNLLMLFEFPISYSLGDFLFATGILPQGTTVTYSSKQDTINGKAVDVITQNVYLAHQVQLAITYSVDPTTDLPVAFHEEASTAAGKQFMSLDQTFTTFQLLTSPAPAATYAFAPPANATLVAAAPAESDNQPSRLLAVGTKAPNFTVQTESGAMVKLSSFSGKVIVVDFWATWCGPCQASLPHTDAIAKTFRPRGVVFLPICSWDQKDSFTAWLKTHKNLTMKFYFDPAGSADNNIAAKLYGVDGIPTQYVIGKDGKVLKSFVGYDEAGDPSEKELASTIKSAIAHT